MKTGLRLTLDGLVRALRMRMHRMAEEIETGYASGRTRREAATSRAQRNRAGGVQGNRAGDDDVSGD